MREIRFRGLSDEHVWVYGWFSDDDLSPVIIDGMSTRHNVLSKTVGQYTGKKDVNKKEIFEGDVVYFIDDRAHERIGVIKWHEKMCCWIIDCGEAGRDMLAYYCLLEKPCIVIGNIWEDENDADRDGE